MRTNWSSFTLAIAVVLLASASLLPWAAAAQSATSPAPISLPKNHQLYDRGEDIRSLQKHLNTHGFVIAKSGPGSPGNETSILGLKTYQALKRFQASQGLPQTGFLGSLTRAKLTSLSTNASSVSISSGNTTNPGNASASTFTLPSWYTKPLPGFAPGQFIFIGGNSPAPSTAPVSIPDTTPPSVSLTVPSSGVTVSGSSVTLTATSADNGGGDAIAGVQFKVDGANVGASGTASPYSITWNGSSVADGSHTLAAVAHDAAGNYATSSISVTVRNTPPVRSGGSPSGTLALNTTSTTLSLTTDEAATCKYSTASGTAYGSMTAFGTTGGTSHSTVVSGLTNGGSYVYYVKCQDSYGNTNPTDYTISFTVAADTTAPTVNVTAPGNNAVVTGSSATVSANATDDVSVAGVQFKLDTNTNIGAEKTSAPYSLTWDSTGVADGTHTIIAVARDGSGNYATSSVITITVDNIAATVSLTAPSSGATVSGSSVTLSATASDTAGVAGVQFKIDGSNLGSLITSSPYTTSWNSTSVVDGSHTIAAVARDVGGNYATSSITITIDNTPPVISAIASSTSQTTATITWTTDEAANSQVNYGTTVSYGTASSSATLATSHSITLTGLTAGTTYHFQVQSVDGQGNTATSSDQTFATPYAGAFAALQLAQTRRVDFIYVSDSNGQYNGWGWASGFTVALGNKYGLYASPVYPQEAGGTAYSTAGNPLFDAIAGATGATTGAPSAQAPFAMPYASYLFQATSSIGNSNGLYLRIAPTDANGVAFNGFNSAANLRYWMGYGTFASGGGSFKPAARYDVSPYTALVTGSTVNVHTGTDGQGITSLSLAAASRAHDVSFRWQLPGGTASVASTTELWQRLENQDATAGISITELYAKAGKDLYDYATTFNGYTQAQWTNYFNTVTYQQVQAGKTPTVVFFINSGDNDINDVRTSIGPIGGLANNTAAGYADNLAACVNAITAAWTGAGLQIGNNGSPGLYFLIVPSHVYGNPDNSTLISMRAAAASYATGKANMSFVDLAALVPYTELIANGGYSAAPHLTNQAYQYIATKLVNTFLH
jgi:hypothetical protein